MKPLVIAGGVAVLAYFLWPKRASAATTTRQPGFGEPGFVAPATPDLPVMVTGCSFARAGNVLVDANTGKVISEEEAQRRAKKEGCTVPGLPIKASAPASMFVTTSGGGVFA